ncbi:restriction endonuclease [Streptomyces jumonjinensis]|uniref:Restriction endonuclease n=2 Tax=Streptomyces jumonjinensis TaxID=1945 RepID=A0A646KQ73_STRJU|nr:restriction endonuclease [Streptomyces jumonjinensis]
MREEQDEVHRLVFTNAESRAYMATSQSLPLSQIDSLHHQQFEELSAWLLQRDGYDIQRGTGGSGDLGADVIAVSRSGQRVVVQCKHVGTSGRNVASRHIHQLNGTAWQTHGADIVIAVTNGGFPKPGRTFAEDHNIHLIDRAALERWATWGRSVDEILGLSEPDAAPAS